MIDYRGSSVVGLALRALNRRNPGPSIIHGAGDRIQVWSERLISRRLLVTISGMLTNSPE